MENGAQVIKCFFLEETQVTFTRILFAKEVM